MKFAEWLTTNEGWFGGGSSKANSLKRMKPYLNYLMETKSRRIKNSTSLWRTLLENISL